MTRLRTLIVDDEWELRKSVITILQSTLPDFDFEIDEAANGREALEKVTSQSFDLVLMDVRMPEMGGLEALHAIKTLDPRIFVVLMTAHGNLQDAILAIKEGAYDYVEKPVQPDRLVTIVKKALDAQEMVSSLTLTNPIFDDDVDSEFVGHSQKMREVFDLIYRLCKVDTNVLIRGESGTGKELVAKAIHYNSPLKNGAFITINCSAIVESEMESELFGHEKAAFPQAHERKIGKFQLANNGTLFLDEVAVLRADMQVKLLKVIQERKFMPVGSSREVKTNARIIAATNQNLEKGIEEGQFREDLFYRLNVMPIFLAPLRERRDDIAELCMHFLRKFSRKYNREISAISDLASKGLRNYRWPGNIQELENVIEHAFLLESSNTIHLENLPENVRTPFRADKIDEHPYTGPLDFDAFKERVEKDFIVSALKANQGKINKTVAHANIPKNTLLRKIKKYGINVRQYAHDGDASLP